MGALIVFGYGPGISHATAERFGREGCSLALAGRNAERLAEGASRLKAMTTRWIWLESWRTCPASSCPGTHLWFDRPGTPLEREMSLHRHQVHDGLSASRHHRARSGGGQRLLLARDHRRYPRRDSAAVLLGSPVSDRSQPGDCRGRGRRARHGIRRRPTWQPDAPGRIGVASEAIEHDVRLHADQPFLGRLKIDADSRIS
jgi:hypothetical protein